MGKERGMAARAPSEARTGASDLGVSDALWVLWRRSPNAFQRSLGRIRLRAASSIRSRLRNVGRWTCLEMTLS